MKNWMRIAEKLMIVTILEVAARILRTTAPLSLSM